MTDEHVQRYWAEAHNEFTGDLDRGLLRLGQFLKRRLQLRQAIDKAYAPAARTAVKARPPVNDTARAALAGLLACVATPALLVSVALFANSGTIAPSELHAGTPVISHVVFA